MTARLARYYVPYLIAFALGACQSTMMAPQKSLYDRLAARPRSPPWSTTLSPTSRPTTGSTAFSRGPIFRASRSSVEQICQATGGPCTYTGRSMQAAHKGMNITDAQFNALVEDLKKSLDKFKVPDKEQGELLSALASLKPQIVGQ